MWSFFDKTYITIFKYKGVLYRLLDDNKYQVFTETEKLETDIEPSYRYCHFKMNDIIYESVFTTDIMIFVERNKTTSYVVRSGGITMKDLPYHEFAELDQIRDHERTT